MTAAPADSPQKGVVLCTPRMARQWRTWVARRFENVDEVYFFEFEEGRIAEAWGIEDTLDRMRQLGLTG